MKSARRTKRIEAYTHPPEPLTIVNDPLTPCPCGGEHHEGAAYYASVIEDPQRGPDSRMVLAAGPFPTHQEALAQVDRVRTAVLERWNPNGRAHWYGYGTVAVKAGYDRPGKLNAELGLAA